MHSIKVGAIIGGGSWGSAIANIISKNLDIVKVYNQLFNQDLYYEKLKSNPKVILTTNLVDIIDSEFFVFAVPSKYMKDVCSDLNNILKNVKFNKKPIFVIATKGIESESLSFMSDIIKKNINIDSEVAVLSGPNFAIEVIKDDFSISNIACENKDVGIMLSHLFTSKSFITYYIDDVLGVQICGAIKNVYAIMNGILYAMSYSENTKAAFLTFIISELSQIMIKLGGKSNTIMSPAGIGDLLLTCTNETSRNMSFGKGLANNKNIQELISNVTVEGYYTTKSIYNICLKNNIHAPILEFLYDILYNNKKIDKANIDYLLRHINLFY